MKTFIEIPFPVQPIQVQESNEEKYAWAYIIYKKIDYFMDQVSRVILMTALK